MDHQRMLDKEHEPTEEEMVSTIGQAAAAWLDVRRYIEENYDFVPERIFYGKKYGWTVRYRKGGKTLCSLFPERDAFTALVVLGGKEAEKALSILNEFSPGVRALLEGTEQLHDGCWLWVRALTDEDAEDVKRLLTIKRKPKEAEK